ncbi:polyprenyl synthetase family protein [Parendozoicomonas haliclonae]|uniref:Farnesyl diphosphate synthase n=1 Tax=Parendozoicomonas haliclonae TaxID=1960125 RepID=A0A1X7AN38_9GAMM|nr:farnesyl diphosphate synthase [Parendozoicomonas haliclonae]SMA49493.1 Farnesyl diphosphate synthase [Parendozoicomonas haliclonae]
MHFSDYLASCQQWANAGLSASLERANIHNDRIREAMAYSTLAGGKRVRPLLVLASCEALGGTAEQALPAACAIELIHTYSLIHDDLPAMDDDDLRRGRPTCHKAFDEATAILAGDALLTLAFEVVADHDQLPAEIRLKQSLALAKAAGCNGMIEGQARDMQATGRELTLDELKALHEHKTGALIRVACSMGALAANANPDQRAALEEYADAIGLAFQVQDDILDVTATAEEMGKTQGSDIAQGKNTYVSLLGLDAAKQEAQSLYHKALSALERVADEQQTLRLRELAAYIIHRNS